MEYREQLHCPIVDREIEAIDCILVSDVADGQAPRIVAPPEFTTVQDWEKTCAQCPYHDKAN
jgi:hypothetical protein